MIRLISVIMSEETHTIASRVSQYRPRTRHLPCKAEGPGKAVERTLLPDQRVVPVVGVVRISRDGRAAVTDDAEVELEEFVAEAAGVA